jgi:hypothetical protein
VSDVLTDAGWLVVPFAAGDDAFDCWQKALQTHRAAVLRG